MVIGRGWEGDGLVLEMCCFGVGKVSMSFQYCPLLKAKDGGDIVNEVHVT
jgi:hypothetical protein